MSFKDKTSRIENGPGVFDFMNSLFAESGVEVTFKVRLSEKMVIHTDLCIDGIKREDGSGRSFMVTFVNKKGDNFKGYYNLKTCKGYIKNFVL